MTDEELEALKHIMYLAEEYCDEYNNYTPNAGMFTILEKYIKEQEG